MAENDKTDEEQSLLIEQKSVVKNVTFSIPPPKLLPSSFPAYKNAPGSTSTSSSMHPLNDKADDRTSNSESETEPFRSTSGSESEPFGLNGSSRTASVRARSDRKIESPAPKVSRTASGSSPSSRRSSLSSSSGRKGERERNSFSRTSSGRVSAASASPSPFSGLVSKVKEMVEKAKSTKKDKQEKSYTDRRPKPKQFVPSREYLFVKIIAAQGLLAMDRSGTSDPYVMVSFGKSVARGRTLYKQLNPLWNQVFAFANVVDEDDYYSSTLLLENPCAAVTVEVYDEDKLSRDDPLGVVRLSTFIAPSLPPPPPSKTKGRKRKTGGEASENKEGGREEWGEGEQDGEGGGNFRGALSPVVLDDGRVDGGRYAEAKWYPLLKRKSYKYSVQGEICVSMWRGFRNDVAFSDAWQSDVGGLPQYKSRIYPSPDLWLLSVVVLEAKNLPLASKRVFPELIVKMRVGDKQSLQTKPAKNKGVNPTWGEDMGRYLFVIPKPGDASTKRDKAYTFRSKAFSRTFKMIGATPNRNRLLIEGASSGSEAPEATSVQASADAFRKCDDVAGDDWETPGGPEPTGASGPYFPRFGGKQGPSVNSIEIQVVDMRSSSSEDVLGTAVVPFSSIFRRTSHVEVPIRWLQLDPYSSTASASSNLDPAKNNPNLTPPSSSILTGSTKPQLSVRVAIEGGYRVNYESDLHPSSSLPSDHANMDGFKYPIGQLEIAIHSARNLNASPAESTITSTAPVNASGAINTYALAKFGHTWARTKTVLCNRNPVYQEQFMWDVYDPANVITIGVFENKFNKSALTTSRDAPIGKLKIRLNTLQSGRIYKDKHPILLLTKHGVKQTGELSLSICLTFFCPPVTLLKKYSDPPLPPMHYYCPIQPKEEEERIKAVAMEMVASELSGDYEPPLQTDVVHFLLDYDEMKFSVRKVKANIMRIKAVLAAPIEFAKLVKAAASWEDVPQTLVVYFIYFCLIFFLRYTLCAILLLICVRGVYLHRFKPLSPLFMDAKLSQGEDNTFSKDQMGEFDEFEEDIGVDDSGSISARSNPIKLYKSMKAKYEKLKGVAGQIQNGIGEAASFLERVQFLLSWRDPRATSFLCAVLVVLAIAVLFVPIKPLLLFVGWWQLRPPKLRKVTPPKGKSTIGRLPSLAEVTY